MVKFEGSKQKRIHAQISRLVEDLNARGGYLRPNEPAAAGNLRPNEPAAAGNLSPNDIIDNALIIFRIKRLGDLIEIGHRSVYDFVYFNGFQFIEWKINE